MLSPFAPVFLQGFVPIPMRRPGMIFNITAAPGRDSADKAVEASAVGCTQIAATAEVIALAGLSYRDLLIRFTIP